MQFNPALISNQPKIALPEIPELSLEEKLSLATLPNVKSALQEQYEELERQRQIAQVENWQTQIQAAAEAEAKKLRIPTKFRIFLHPNISGQYTKEIEPGVIVHIHLEVDIPRLTSKQFWVELRALLPLLPRCVRSNALVLRSYYWEQREATVPKWKKIRVEDAEIEINILPTREIEYESEIKIIRRHSASGIVVIVTGAEYERESLEREAILLLSQKVAAYNYMRNKQTNE